jgi:phage terminase large subunit
MKSEKNYHIDFAYASHKQQMAYDCLMAEAALSLKIRNEKNKKSPDFNIIAEWEKEINTHYLNPINFIGYGGGAFSGKSWLECYWITTMCMAFPGTAWGLGRKELVYLKKTTLVTLWKVFSECNIISPRDYKYSEKYNTITFTNKSIIFLLDTAYQPSDHLYSRFGSLELSGCAIDESAETDYRAIDILWTRTGRCRNDEYKIGRKFLETFNPDKGHVYRRYYKPWKEGKLKSSYRFIKALPRDNPAAGVDDYIKGIINESDETTVQRLINGNFEYDDDPAKLINLDKAHDVFSNFHVQGGSKYVTSDIARLGGDRIVIIEWDGMRGKVSAFDKKLLTNTTTAIEASRVRNGCGKSGVLVDSDGMGSGVQDFGGYKGFINGSSPMPDPKNPVDANGKPVKENFDNLKSQCGFRMAEIINANGLYLEVEDWMKDLIIEEFEQVKQKQLDSDMKKGLVPKQTVKEKLGRSPDFWDAILMRIWFELKPKFVVTADTI